MNMSAEDKLFEKIDTISVDIAGIKTDIAILKRDVKNLEEKERPAIACRDHIETLCSVFREGSEEQKSDLNKLGNKVTSGLASKVGWGVFYLIISLLIGLTIGAYTYTYNTNSRIDKIYSDCLK